MKFRINAGIEKPRKEKKKIEKAYIGTNQIHDGEVSTLHFATQAAWSKCKDKGVEERGGVITGSF